MKTEVETGSRRVSDFADRKGMKSTSNCSRGGTSDGTETGLLNWCVVVRGREVCDWDDPDKGVVKY